MTLASNSPRPGRSLTCRPVLLLLALTAGAIGCGEEEVTQREIPPLPVFATVLEATDLPRTVTSVGSLESPEMTTVASEIAGTVVEVSAREGERVEVGYTVLRLDDTEARANLKVRDAQLKNARDRLARIERLHSDGVASQARLDDAQAVYDAADGARRAARTRLARHVLRAPYAGTLGLFSVDLGDYIDRGDPIVEISDTSALELRFALPQRFIAQVETEQTVYGIVGRCGPRFEGRVIAVDPRVDPETRMVGVRAAVPNAEGLLHPGMAVRLRVVTGTFEDAILLPQEAIIRQGTKHIVQVVDEEDRAQPREIRIGDYYLDGAHVTEGLAPGEKVVVAGQQKLRQPGMKVIPSPDDRASERNPVAEVGRYGPAGCESS